MPLPESCHQVGNKWPRNGARSPLKAGAQLRCSRDVGGLHRCCVKKMGLLATVGWKSVPRGSRGVGRHHRCCFRREGCCSIVGGRGAAASDLSVVLMLGLHKCAPPVRLWLHGSGAPLVSKWSGKTTPLLQGMSLPLGETSDWTGVGTPASGGGKRVGVWSEVTVGRATKVGGCVACWGLKTCGSRTPSCPFCRIAYEGESLKVWL